MTLGLWRGIVKVQRNLNPPAGTFVSIRSEDMTIYLQDDITDQLRKWFRTGEHKFYAEAELTGTLINLIRKVPEQDW
jgi:hypothetical protein